MKKKIQDLGTSALSLPVSSEDGSATWLGVFGGVWGFRV